MEENKEDNFLEEVAHYLQSKNFVEENPGLFKIQRTITQPGATLVVNGQQMQQPGREFIHVITVEFFGPGIVEEGTDREDRFEEIHFKVEDLDQNGKFGNVQEIVEGFYPEDLNQIKGIINQLVS